ncbi:C-C chemokine receptor type 3-like [Watersipora subatra]|uniref:C-C chemokine receptor type 3-like n=1 Tax=Watersipora subatra TaxID=2589382 RepID=UPI00355B2251
MNESLSNISEVGEDAKGASSPAATASIDENLMYWILLAVSTIGFLINLYIFLLVIIRHKSKWKKHLILLVNIMLCDILISLGGLLIASGQITENSLKTSPDYSGTDEQNGLIRRFDCTGKVARKIWNAGTYANLFGLLLMTVDHFIAVRWSLMHITVITKKWAVQAVLVVWLLAVVLAFLEDILIEPTYTEIMDDWDTKFTTRYCYQRIVYKHTTNGIYTFDLNQDGHTAIIAVISIVTISLTFVTMATVYTYIAYVVISISRRKKAQNNRFSATRPNLKGIGTTILLLCTFLILYLPITISYFAQVFGNADELSYWWTHIFNILVTMTGIADILIYGCRDKDVQAALRCGRSSSSSSSPYQTTQVTSKRTSQSQLSVHAARRTSRAHSEKHGYSLSPSPISASCNSLRTP